MHNNDMDEDLLRQMLGNQKLRRFVTKRSFWYFFALYFGQHATHRSAEFQKEIIKELESSAIKSLYLTAFRDSGKSTIAAMMYPLWAILGVQQKKYVLIICRTQGQAKQSLRNIRDEAEGNSLLKKDLGPFRVEDEFGKNGEWTSTTLEFLNSGAKIKVASVNESIRGLRHRQHRPDLIICDDIEDINSTRTQEGRHKTYRLFKGDIVPAGDVYTTRIIVIGNKLHEDSLLMRLKAEVESGEGIGTYMEFPLLKHGVCLWPEKYPTKESIERQRLLIGNEIDWQREFLLNIVPDMNQVIFKEWFHRYDVLPPLDRCFAGVIAGIDLAFGINEWNDFTAIVIAYAFYFEREWYLYLQPNPINDRIQSPDFLELCKTLNTHYKKRDMPIKFLVEQAGQQLGVIDQLSRERLHVQGIKVGNQDKLFRQRLIGPEIKSAHVLFPRKGCEKLEYQLTHFGVGHDDLADALATLVLGTVEHPPRYRRSPGDIIVGGTPRTGPLAETDRFRVTMNTRF